MHAWDDPAETLVSLAPQYNVELVMPRLGEVVEPARFEGVTPWWRAVSEMQRDGKALATEEPPSLPPPASGVPWPLD
jgi:hypothetical protein